MPEIKLSQTQKLSQSQVMKLSQQQLMAINLIAMGNMELREEIYRKAEENPALEITRDKFAEGASRLKQGNSSSQSSVHTGNSSKSGTEAAEKFQKLLENAPDNSETLQSHLLHQLNMLNIPEIEEKLCRKLILNLNEQGFHILAPVSLVDKTSGETPDLLEKCISTVQHFDPEGICCENISESLKIQAELKKNAPNLALFLLNGNLEMLKPPVPEKIQKKILGFLADQKKLAFSSSSFDFSKEELSLENIENAVKFIQNLDPFPARNFSGSAPQYIEPDVYIQKDSDGLVKIQLAQNVMPEIQLAADFKSMADEKENSGTANDFIQLQLKNAKAFLDTLEFRNTVLLKAFIKLAEIQKDFFEKGPGFLVPLTQRKFSEEIQVHESTVSRMADSKYIRCDWGTFPVKYFFSAAVDNVKIEIENILKAQKPGEKRLSDQKIADMLSEKGIEIARRTVSKYRSQMDIGSSYERI